MRCGPAVGVVGILVSIVACSYSSDPVDVVPEQKSPAWNAPWAEPGTKVLESGTGGEFMYSLGLLDKTEALEVWRWAGQKLERHAQVPLEKALVVAWIGAERCVFQPVKTEALGVHDCRKNGEVEPIMYEAGWYATQLGVSRKGEHTAVLLAEDCVRKPADFDWNFTRARVGVLDNQKMTMTWAATMRRGPGTMPSSISISDDGRYAAVNGWGGGVGMVDAEAGKVLWEMRPPRELDTETSAFSPDGEVLYMGGDEGCVYAVKAKTGQVLHEWFPSPKREEKYGRQIILLAASPDGRLVAAGMRPDGLVCVMDAKTGKHLLYVNRGLSVLAVSFSPDSRWLATDGGGGFRVWEMPGEKGR